MIRKISAGVTTIFVCSALAVTIPFQSYASEGFGTNDAQTMQDMAQQNEQDRNDSIRIFKFRMLKALNVLRDAGFTPQSIMEEIRGSHGAPESVQEAGQAASDEFQSQTGDMVSALQESAQQAVSDATEGIAEAAGNAASDVVDQATDAAKEKADDAIEDLGEQIRRSLQEFIDGIFHKSGE